LIWPFRKRDKSVMDNTEAKSPPSPADLIKEDKTDYAVPSVPRDLLELHLKRFHKRLADCSQNPTPVRLHDLRVTTRRLRVLLQALSPIAGEKRALSRFKKSIETILDNTDGLSDLNIVLKILKAQGARYVSAKRIVNRRRREITTLRADASRFLKEFEESEHENIKALSLKLSAPDRTPPVSSALFEFDLASQAARYERATRRRMGCDLSDSQAMHGLRISLRKLRYTIEFSRPYFGDRVNDAIREAKKLQTVLGDIHDMDITIGMLDTMPAFETARLKAAISRARDTVAATFIELKAGIEKVRLDRTRDGVTKGGDEHLKDISRLVLMRHGSAVKSGTKGIDPDELRPLVKKGRSEVRRISRKVRKFDIVPDMVFSSQAVRSLQTAMIASEELDFSGEIDLLDELAPGRSARDAAEAVISRLGIGKTVLVTGHEPQLGILTAMLTSGAETPIPLSKGGTVVIRFAGTPKVGSGVIDILIQPGMDGFISS